MGHEASTKELLLSYVPTSGLSDEQVSALVDIESDQLKQLDVSTRAELAMRHEELQLAQKDSFWMALQSASTVLLPLAISVGLVSLLGGK